MHMGYDVYKSFAVDRLEQLRQDRNLDKTFKKYARAIRGKELRRYFGIKK